LAALGAAVMLCIAFYLWLATWLTPAGAAAATAGGLLAFTLLLLVVAWLCVRLRRRRAAAAPDRPPAAGSLGVMAGQMLGSSMGANPIPAMLLALAAGFVVGLKPDLIRTLSAVLAADTKDEGRAGASRPHK
jgi:hypothetical protein